MRKRRLFCSSQAHTGLESWSVHEKSYTKLINFTLEVGSCFFYTIIHVLFSWTILFLAWHVIPGTNYTSLLKILSIAEYDLKSELSPFSTFSGDVISMHDPMPNYR